MRPMSERLTLHIPTSPLPFPIAPLRSGCLCATFWFFMLPTLFAKVHGGIIQTLHARNVLSVRFLLTVVVQRVSHVQKEVTRVQIKQVSVHYVHRDVQLKLM